MKILEFLQELVKRGGNPKEVKIVAPSWSGAWRDGVFLDGVDALSITVSPSFKSPSIRLVTSHPVFDFEVDGCHRLFGKDFFPHVGGRSLVSKVPTYTVLRVIDPVDRVRI
jgi:hypothetical protein